MKNIESHKRICSCIDVRTYKILVMITLSDSLIFSSMCQKEQECELATLKYTIYEMKL